jgi:hypothetical protein
MSFLRRFLVIFVSCFLLSIIFSNRAYAYLDLGTGSYIFQMIIAIFIGGLFALKLFWKKVRNFFSNLFSGKEKS